MRFVEFYLHAHDGAEMISAQRIYNILYFITRWTGKMINGKIVQHVVQFAQSRLQLHLFYCPLPYNAHEKREEKMFFNFLGIFLSLPTISVDFFLFILKQKSQ